jgi:hypothetical protein
MKAFMLGLMSGLMFWPVVGSAQLYKWTDDQGNLHITDTPPSVAQKKSATTPASAPRSTLPKKTTVRPTLPEQPQAEVHPVPGPLVKSPTGEELSIQLTMKGLSPSQATLTSSWRVFDGSQMHAKAPVQRWKDEQGRDHFVDVLPSALGGEGATKSEISASRSVVSGRDRPTAVSRKRHQATE